MKAAITRRKDWTAMMRNITQLKLYIMVHPVPSKLNPIPHWAEENESRAAAESEAPSTRSSKTSSQSSSKASSSYSSTASASSSKESKAMLVHSSRAPKLDSSPRSTSGRVKRVVSHKSYGLTMSNPIGS